jgi:hypothetical protein
VKKSKDRSDWIPRVVVYTAEDQTVAQVQGCARNELQMLQHGVEAPQEVRMSFHADYAETI